MPHGERSCGNSAVLIVVSPDGAGGAGALALGALVLGAGAFAGPVSAPGAAIFAGGDGGADGVAAGAASAGGAGIAAGASMGWRPSRPERQLVGMENPPYIIFMVYL